MDENRLIQALENLANAINRAVDMGFRNDSQSKVQQASEMVYAQQKHSTMSSTKPVSGSSSSGGDEEGGDSSTSIAAAFKSVQKKAVGKGVNLVQTLWGKTTEGAPGVLGNIANDVLGTNVRRGVMPLINDFASAGVRMPEGMMDSLIRMEKNQSSILTDMTSSLQRKTHIFPGMLERAQRTISAGFGLLFEEGFQKELGDFSDNYVAPFTPGLSLYNLWGRINRDNNVNGGFK